MRIVAAAVLCWLLGAAGCGDDALVIDGAQLEEEIRSQLDADGVEAADVSCPAARPVEEGDTFTCGVSIEGRQHLVEVEQTSDEGDVEWWLD